MTLDDARARLARWSPQDAAPNRLDAWVPPEELPQAVDALAGWGYLTALTGLDSGAAGLDVLYHFCAAACVVTLRVRLPRETPTVPSIAERLPVAGPFERETADLFGVVFSGTPDSGRLFLADDFPEGVYPLRKDAVLPTGG